MPALGPRDVEVRIEAGGICGSDLHYYYDGGFGTVRLKEPMILGHEIAGTVARVGAEVASVEAGPARRRQPEPAVRRVPLLPGGQAEPLPRHALLRQRDALPARAGRLPRGAGVRRSAGRAGAARDVGRAGGLRRALRGVPARGEPRRAAARQARAGHRRRADRRADCDRGAPRGRGGDRGDRCGRCAARRRQARWGRCDSERQREGCARALWRRQGILST